MLTKRAVDQAAKDYWSAYFGEYGRQWTAEIPRRVAAAILDTLPERKSRQASIQRVQVAPLGYYETDVGGLVFEGVFRCQAAEQPARGSARTASPAKNVVCLFSAQFDGQGRLLALDNKR